MDGTRLSSSTHRVLFGLALVQGGLGILAWGLTTWPASGGPLWHAHEMVFGHALAVIAGFLLTRLSGPALAAITLAWCASRLTYIVPAVPDLVRAFLSLLATAAIVLPAAFAFLRAAKRLSSLVFPILLSGFLIADAVFQCGELRLLQHGADIGNWLGLGLVIMLIAAMGGRLIGAAASGAAQRAGKPRIAPRPALEQALLVCLAVGFVMEAIAVEQPIGPALLAVGSVLIGVRLVLWAPGLQQSAGDVLAMAAGQAWLCVGLLAWVAAAGGWLQWPETAALHLATIGGIGGTTLVMVIRASAQREVRPMPVRSAIGITILIGLAALVRALGPAGLGWATAAVLWTMATILTAVTVFRRQ
ncbi:hypothetical protein CR162_18835 [Pseudoroseomonas rhizosphaerae]|uniref:NnrS family protein n=1 Tax=Teichococcus rhizosphaerae TaxID=1335062 RepID=A0A2C7A8M8_9PROT|nr:hypothetical protein CR162_18835 [Pseudoroseomonas rhizosphaerae]